MSGFLDHLPRGHYTNFLIDPPWLMSLGTKSRPQHYPRMKLAEIMAMPIKDLSHPDGARVFLWLTAPLLDRSREILRAWGFRYCSTRVWVKLWPSEAGMFVYANSIARGTGYEVQGNAEFLVIGKRGKPQSIKGKPWTSVIMEPRREHSRKPDCVREEIAARLEGPRLEIFARSSSPGWDSAGNEITKFDEVAA